MKKPPLLKLYTFFLLPSPERTGRRRGCCSNWNKTLSHLGVTIIMYRKSFPLFRARSRCDAKTDGTQIENVLILDGMVHVRFLSLLCHYFRAHTHTHKPVIFSGALWKVTVSFQKHWQIFYRLLGWVGAGVLTARHTQPRYGSEKMLFVTIRVKLPVGWNYFN